MLPYINENGKIISIASELGRFSNYKNESILNILKSDDTTE